MRYNFVKFGITANLELNEERRDYPFFEQNREKFTQIFDFLSGPKDCFIMTGLQGVGKSKILEEILSYLNNDVLLFRYQMYEATTLDDILFNLIVDFREYQKNLQYIYLPIHFVDKIYNLLYPKLTLKILEKEYKPILKI